MTITVRSPCKHHTQKLQAPGWAPVFYFLAAITAAAVAAATEATVAAAAAQQQNQDDDPPAVVTVVTTHRKYLQGFFSSGVALIPCYSVAQKRCS